MVIWGHAIQHLRNDDFFHNPVFEFIYSFHMPLFFLISGFFFVSSRSVTLFTFLKKKSLQLLLPGLTWFVLLKLFSFTKSLIKQSKTEDFADIFNQILNINNWPFWFLKELFLTYLIVYIFGKFFKKNWLLFIGCMLFVAILPGRDFQRFLLPYFLIGIAIRQHYQYLETKFVYILILSGFIFCTLLFFWDGNYTIYVSNFPKLIRLRTFDVNLLNLDVSVFRFVIGAAGSLFFFCLFYLLNKKVGTHQFLSNIGKETLGIYIIQFLLLEVGLRKLIHFDLTDKWIFNLIITPLIAIVVLIVCNYFVSLIKKNKHLSLFLMGNYITRKQGIP